MYVDSIQSPSYYIPCQDPKLNSVVKAVRLLPKRYAKKFRHYHLISNPFHLRQSIRKRLLLLSIPYDPILQVDRIQVTILLLRLHQSYVETLYLYAMANNIHQIDEFQLLLKLLQIPKIPKSLCAYLLLYAMAYPATYTLILATTFSFLSL